ncbi:MAG: hypothetical protein ACM31C_23960 [Acidobacteriota bacterium]
MRALIALALLAGAARADTLPPGALEVFGGAISGTGADAKRVGFGYQIGASAAWQPMRTENRFGLTLRWSVLFAGLYDGTAEQVNPPLRTVMMDLTAGVRFRPWKSPSRYLTARIGAGLLRANDPIIDGARSYVGPVSSIGLDQYIGTLIVGVDVRYALMPAPLIASGPTQIAVVLRFGVTGP